MDVLWVKCEAKLPSAVEEKNWAKMEMKHDFPQKTFALPLQFTPPPYGTGPRPFDSPKSVRGGKIFPIKNDYDFIGVQKNISQPSAEFLLEGVHIGGGT